MSSNQVETKKKKILLLGGNNFTAKSLLFRLSADADNEIVCITRGNQHW